MDPLSITEGVTSVYLSSKALFLTINDFRKKFQEEAEIKQLAEEVDLLGVHLRDVEEAQSRGVIASRLIDGFIKILQQLNTAIVETEQFLKSAITKKFPGVIWALSGRRQCGQSRRRLESYRLTLFITSTLCNIISEPGLHDKDNQILNRIHSIRRLIAVSEASEDSLLRRYLGELQIVYKNSTIGGGRTITKDSNNDSRNEEGEEENVKGHYDSDASEPRNSTSPISRKKKKMVWLSRSKRRTLKVEISQPELSRPSNTAHLTHVWYDPVHETYNGLPPEWAELIAAKPVTREDLDRDMIPVPYIRWIGQDGVLRGLGNR